MIAIDPNTIYTYKELQQLLGIGEYTARQIKKNSLLRGKKLGGNKYVFSGQQILDFLNTKTIAYSK